MRANTHSNAPWWALLGICVLMALLPALWFRARLPDQVATHFDLSGEADGWSSRGGAIGLHFGLVLAMGAVFATLAGLMPRMPNSWINMRHRDYWLAPERRARTHALLARMLLQFASLMLLFLGFVFYSIYRANTTGEGPPRTSSDFWWLLGAFLAAGGAVLAVHLLQFRRPKEHG